MARLTDVFYGTCTFWTDDWGLLRSTGSTIPCCPHCNSVGFEMDRTEWWRQVRAHEAAGRPGYAAMIAWSKGRCFANYGALELAWVAAGRPGAEAG